MESLKTPELFFRKAIFVLALVLFSVGHVFGQTHTIDSLKSRLAKSHTPVNRATFLLLLCRQSDSFAADTLMRIAQNGEKLAAGEGNKQLAAWFQFYIATAWNSSGQVDSALKRCNTAMAVLPKTPAYQQVYDQFWWLKSICLFKKRQYTDAQQQAFALLNNATAHRDTLAAYRAEIAIGWVYDVMGNYRQSLNWFFKSLRVTTDSSFYKKYCQIYFNIAAIYGTINKMDTAKIYLHKAIRYAQASDNLSQLVNCYAFEAGLFDDAHQFKPAEADYKKALALQQQIGDPFYTIPILINFAEFYDEWHQPKMALKLCNTGLALAEKSALRTRKVALFGTLTETYKLLNDYKDAVATQERLVSLKDSIYQKNTSDELADLQVKYDVQQKENTIAQQRIAILKRNQGLIVISLSVAAIAIISVLLFRNYRAKEKLKIKAMLFEERRVAEKAVRDAEENERKRIAKNLHDNLGVYAASIAANIEQITSRPITESGAALAGLNQNSRYMIAQLSDSIWALNTEALSLTEISDRLKVFIQRIRASHPGVRFDISEDIINDVALPSSKAFNLFQVIQEAITNALKHSKCSLVEITITGKEGWEIIVSDNGTGLSANINGNSGNGINNMRSRSAEAGWQIHWHGASPGTSVVIQNT